MDFQTMLDNMLEVERKKELENSPQLLLGEIILKLEAVKNQDLPLFIDLLDKRPKGIESWRGRYAELAIETETFGSYSSDEIEAKYPEVTFYRQKQIGCEDPSVKQWIEVLKEAVGKTFVGYKGGDFKMSKNTPVWLAEYSECSFKIDGKKIDEKDYSNYKHVYFIDVREEKYKVYLVTKIVEE